MPILKPSLCQGCPFYSLSSYITPDRMLKDSSILILAQNPGANEENGSKLLYRKYKEEITEKVSPQPLIGSTGKWLEQEFWPLTKLPFNNVSKANVIKCRPYNKNDLPSINSNKPVNGITVKMLKEAITHCTSKYLRIPDSIEHIMAMGGISLYSLVGEIEHRYIEKGKEKKKKEGITDWRGWVIGSENSHTHYGIHDYYDPSKPTSSSRSKIFNIFPVLHIASLFQSEKYYHATLLDFIRFGKLVRGEWPEALPDIKINVIPPSIPKIIGFDTEYDPEENNRLIMWSLADIERNVYVVDAERSSYLQNLPESLTLVTQNGLVDIPHFSPLVSYNSSILQHINLEDCMLAHSTQWTGEPNNLDYILSKYGLYNRHKHLRTSPNKELSYLYAALDADSTLNAAWRGLLRDFEKDRLSWQEYKLRRQPLLSIINKSQQKGLRVYQERVSFIAETLDKEIAEIEAKVKELTGNTNFNIASWQQVSRAIHEGEWYDEEENAEKIERAEKARDVTPKLPKEPKERAKRKKLSSSNALLIERLEQLKLELGVE